LLGAKLKKLRMSKGKSLQQVADAVEASKAHIWQLEIGKSSNPSLDLIRRLADYFEVSVAFLVGENLDSENDNLTVMFRDLKKLEERDRETVNVLIKDMLKRKRSDDDD
jgi:transcriptional regulator with XRE-family HTH domain